MEAQMNGRTFLGALALGVMLAATFAVAQTKPPTEGPSVGETPGWFLQGSFPDPTGRTIVDPGGKVTVPPREDGAGGRGGARGGGRGAGAPAPMRGTTPGVVAVPACS